MASRRRLIFYTKDINVQQRPDDCQQKFLSQKSLSLSGIYIDTDIDIDIDTHNDIQGQFFKCYKKPCFLYQFCKTGG